MSADLAILKLEQRMGSGEPFTYGELAELVDEWGGRENETRLADRTIQRWRLAGLNELRVRIAKARHASGDWGLRKLLYDVEDALVALDAERDHLKRTCVPISDDLSCVFIDGFGTVPLAHSEAKPTTSGVVDGAAREPIEIAKPAEGEG